MKESYSKALIVGSGSGLSASLARLLAREGFKVALAARDVEKLVPLTKETGAAAFACDATVAAEVDKLFDDVERKLGAPDVVIYNASARSRGPLISLAPADVDMAMRVSAFGAFLVAQQAVKRMLPKGAGA